MYRIQLNGLIFSILKAGKLFWPIDFFVSNFCPHFLYFSNMVTSMPSCINLALNRSRFYFQTFSADSSPGPPPSMVQLVSLKDLSFSELNQVQMSKALETNTLVNSSHFLFIFCWSVRLQSCSHIRKIVCAGTCGRCSFWYEESICFKHEAFFVKTAYSGKP